TRGLPVDELALTIKDVIRFTRAMEFRYLCVDALCIVQDDDGDKAEELPLMGTFYKQSALTIAAVS
ncbi:heterokaryon incompatibility, partial [Parathielavia appendiculata]